MVTPSAKVAPVLRSVTVWRTPEEAFRLFTEEIAAWWPLPGHSIGEQKVVDIVFEKAEGGRVYEVWDDGTQHDWARLLAWEPPSRFVMAWKPNHERPAPTEVEITFTAEGAGTRVDVEHREWDRIGEDAAEVRESYAGGWGRVLDALAKHAS